MMTTQEFEATWQTAEVRFPYALNRGLLILYGSLLTGFWAYWAVSVINGGLDWVLGIIGVIFGSVSVFVLGNILYWRHFARFSGAICTDDDLMWRQGNQAWKVPWKVIDWDTLGLVDFDPNTQKYEYFWSVGGHRLYLYRAHVRMRSMEIFMAVVLKSLKEAGRTPVSESKQQPKLKPKPKAAGNKGGRKKSTRRPKGK